MPKVGDTKKVSLGIFILALIHFSFMSLFSYFSDLEFNLVAQIVFSLIFAVIFVLVMKGIKLWQKQWKNKHN